MCTYEIRQVCQCHINLVLTKLILFKTKEYMNHMKLSELNEIDRNQVEK